jgi:hypothetical protein
MKHSFKACLHDSFFNKEICEPSDDMSQVGVYVNESRGLC